MKSFCQFLALAALIAPASAQAVPGGKLATLTLGSWVCELPGDAVTQPEARPDETFTAVADSSYVTAGGGRGSYLLLGDLLVMTSGPREGERYRLESPAMIRKLTASGEPGPLRCVRAGDPAALALSGPVAAAPVRPAEADAGSLPR